MAYKKSPVSQNILAMFYNIHEYRRNKKSEIELLLAKMATSLHTKT